MRTQSVHFSHHQCGIFILHIQILCYKSVAAALQQTEMHFMHVGRDPDTGLVLREPAFPEQTNPCYRNFNQINVIL